MRVVQEKPGIAIHGIFCSPHLMNWAFPTAGMQHPAITQCTGERWAELEMLREREGGQGWGFLVPQAVPSSLASRSPLAWPISPSPGTKRGFSSACSVDLPGQTLGSVCPTDGCSPHFTEQPALGGETFSKQCFSLRFLPSQRLGRNLPACCLPLRSALEKTPVALL